MSPTSRKLRLAAGHGSARGLRRLSVGDLLAGKYRVERVVGEGGMGLVVEAHHELLDQRVAVKLLYQDIADEEAQSRLLLEARAAAKLHSEHVARVLDVDVGPDGLPFIIMELLQGADLQELASRTGALPRWLVVDYMLQALEGLAHAHGQGIIHRDLKPSNLFLATRPDGAQIIKILDFGISKSQDGGLTNHDALRLTGGHTVLGSPPYMSPEQIRQPKIVDLRTDIWSIGVCMYELLTQAMPFGGDEVQETFAAILEKKPKPIRSHIAGVPDGLEQVVMRCLSKNRDERYANVADLAQALVPFGSGTWAKAASRIEQTLARGEELSAPRMRAIPTPGRSEDPLPTTASVAPPRFTAAGRGGWVTALAVLASAALLAATVARRTYVLGAPEAPRAEAHCVEAPPPDVAADARIAAPIAPNVLGASAAPAEEPGAATAAAPPSKPKPVHPAKKAAPPPPASAAKALPVGLPNNRSGI